jgi:transposase
MISFSQGARIVVATKPVDFRRGGESLASLAREVLKEDPYKGVIVIFRSRRADRIKVVTWDKSGLVMAWKALNGTGFYWPPIVDGTMRLSSEQAMVLFSGMDWKRFQPLETTAPTASR